MFRNLTEVELIYCKTDAMAAGIFTKAFTNPIKWQAALDLRNRYYSYLAVSGLQLAAPRHHVGWGYTKPKAPPLIPKPITIVDDEDNGAPEQHSFPCEHMIREHLNQDTAEIN